MKLHLVLLTAVVALALSGCARFSTKQIDARYESGKPSTTITTKASAWTFWEAQSVLTQFKALQTDKSQSATVGTIGESGGGPGTNVVGALNALVELAKQIK